MLKDIYPLYLNNKAEQPNTDLEVTDKYTGTVAFRCAQLPHAFAFSAARSRLRT